MRKKKFIQWVAYLKKLKKTLYRYIKKISDIYILNVYQILLNWLSKSSASSAF